MSVILLVHQKGGVGKLTTAVNLAIALLLKCLEVIQRLMLIHRQRYVDALNAEKMLFLSRFHVFD